MLSLWVLTALVLSSLSSQAWAHNIEDFGAKAGYETFEIAVSNAKAFVKAFLMANASETDRTVLVPSGRSYYMYAANLSLVNDVTIQLDGNLKYSDEIHRWPSENFALLYFSYCHGIRVTGRGMIDGQGLNWWRMAYTGQDHRPDMLSFHYSTDILIDSVLLYSSPKYSINFIDCRDVVIHDITIFVNTSLVRGKDKHSSVTYALNTDGIDIAAYNVTLFNNAITNYDDAIVVKPCRSTWTYCTCSGAILAYNNTITYSTGLTIGSVPPNGNTNCVRDVIFRNNTMHRPLKAIYIKSNPGTSGTGIIEDILYEDILIDHALWWTVWIGPQQQNQPGGEDTATGCNFLFPFVPTCPTQPLVSIKNVVLRNVHAIETIPLFEGPGVILCDEANPCTGFVFENVTNTVYTGTIEQIYAEIPIFYIPGVIFPTPYRSDDWVFEYITAHVQGKLAGEVAPVPCLEDNCYWGK